MLTTTKAIVLRTTKYGETKLFVDFYTEQFGRMTMVTSAVRKGRQQGRVNLFQPLGIVEVEMDMKPAVAMQKIRGARIAYPAVSIPFDPYKISIAIFLSEFLTYALRDEQRDEQLFRYICSSIEWLDNAATPFANFHLVFMVRLLPFLGICPNVESYAKGAFLDLREGLFTSLIPPHSDYLNVAEACVGRLLLRLSFRTMPLLRLSRVERNRCAEVVLRYYRLHIPGFPELKSFAVMQELFA